MSRQITLEVYKDPGDPQDKDASFKSDVASYSHIDPLPVLDKLSKNLKIPIGSLTSYILAKWVCYGSEGLLEIGPRVANQMLDMVVQAEEIGTQQAKVRAYDRLAGIIAWLNSG